MPTALVNLTLQDVADLHHESGQYAIHCPMWPATCWVYWTPNQGAMVYIQEHLHESDDDLCELDVEMLSARYIAVPTPAPQEFEGRAWLKSPDGIKALAEHYRLMLEHPKHALLSDVKSTSL